MRSMTNRSRPGAQPGTACCYADYGTSLAALHNYFAARGGDSSAIEKNGFRIIAISYRTDYAPADLEKETDLYPACDAGNLRPTFPSPASYRKYNRRTTYGQRKAY